MSDTPVSPVVAESAAQNAQVETKKSEPTASDTVDVTEEATNKKPKSEEGKDADTEMKDDDTNPNGDSTPAAAEPADSSTAPATTEQVGEDSIMKDAEPEDNVQATPASTKKTPNGSSKKKGSGVPEHKGKKLNKKKSKPVLHLNAKPGQLFLARMKGHQPWPSIICDEDMIPESLLNSRPVTTASADGTFKKPDYAPGGKREHERTFPIMFLFTNEFAWLPNTELTPLTPDECKDVVEKGKSKGLLEAYKVAAEGQDLAYYKEMLLEHQTALQEDADRKAEAQAKKAEKAANKGKRKSKAADDDTMDVDEDAAEKPAKGKKRKSAPDGDEGGRKPPKTPKTSTKIKLTFAKNSEGSSAAKEKAAGGSDNGADSPQVAEVSMTREAALEAKDKEIRYYRHKLQKGFITRDYHPSEKEIEDMSGYLTSLEKYPDLEPSIIRSTKINKVLKAMIRLPSIPKDEEFHFKQRSTDLLGKWSVVLASETTGGEGAETNDKEKQDDKKEEKKDDKDDKPETKAEENDEDKNEAHATNGVKTSEALDADAPVASIEEPKLGTAVEGEKEADKAADKQAESEKPAEDVKTDEADIEKPAEAYQPPAESTEATA